MKFLHKYGTRSNEIRRARKELYFRLTLVLAVFIFFILMVAITQFRPRLSEEAEANRPDTSARGDPMTNPALVRSRSEVDSLMESFESGAQGKSAELEDLKLLEQAIQLQRQVIGNRGSEIAPSADIERLEELMTLYDEEMGAFLIGQSKRLEEEAEAEMSLLNYNKAIELLTRALKLQEEVNTGYPRSSGGSATRLHEMKRKITAWQTQPLAKEADRLKEEAYSLVSQKQYKEAKVTIQKALIQQQTLNRTYRNSRLASLSRLKTFEDAVSEIQAAEDLDKVEELMADARQALKNNDQMGALSKAEAAEIIQRRIITQFPDDPEEHLKTLAEIEVLRDTGASLPSILRIRDLQTRTRRALVDENMDAFKSLVAEWKREIQGFQRRFTKSEFLAEATDLEVSFLHDRVEEVPAIIEMVRSGLVAVPGHSGLYLFNSEVHQTLYASVTGENPSNSKNPKYPVESITWEEAMAFNQRLGWVLGRPVLLPSREIFLDALGSMDRETVASRAWSSGNTNRETQPVKSLEANDLGFHDLLGNVAEWLASSSGETPNRVVAIGGAVRDSSIRLTSIPEETRLPSERNRFVGFRFVVKMDD